MNLFGDMINKSDVNVNIMSFCEIDYSKFKSCAFRIISNKCICFGIDTLTVVQS